MQGLLFCSRERLEIYSRTTIECSGPTNDLCPILSLFGYVQVRENPISDCCDNVHHYQSKNVRQNEDFAFVRNPPSVTLVSFGCCELLAVSLTGCVGVGGAFKCVYC